MLTSIFNIADTAQNILARVDIDPKTGLPVAPPSIIANALPPTLGYDDFAVNSKGEAFVANVAGNFIERVDAKGKQVSPSQAYLSFSKSFILYIKSRYNHTVGLDTFPQEAGR